MADGPVPAARDPLRPAPGAHVAAHSRPFQPVRALTGLAGFVGFGLAISGVYATTGIGFPCPFRAITGWQCPFCGGTRLGAALLRGHVGQAFGYNPLVFIGLIVMTVLGAFWVVEALGGPAIRPPRRITERLAGVHPVVWAAVIGGLAVVYTVTRHVMGF